MPERSPFDPPLEDMRLMGRRVIDVVAEFVEGRNGASTSDYSALGPLLRSLRMPPPETPSDLASLLQTIENAASKGFDPANPGFVAYIPGGGLYASALADFIACVINRYTGLSRPAPALVQLEASVLRWLCDLFGLGRESQGILTPGGSMSNLSAIVTARTAMLGEHFLEGTLYVSDEVHHSIAKAAHIAGLPGDALRVIPTDDSLHMDIDALSEAIVEDRRRRRKPFMVVASAGTINTGAIDPLESIAELAHAAGLWFHVDAAYGGFFQLTQRGRKRLSGIDEADSITLDPHKGLFLPYGTGCLLVRDRDELRRAHDAQAQYLPPPSNDPGLPDFSAYSPELTRDFRGLRLWLPLHLHGVATFEQALDEKLDLAAFLYEELVSTPGLTVPWAPELSLVAFRPAQSDARTLLEQVNSSGRLWMSSADFRGHTHLRICILSHRTRWDRIREAVQLIRGAL